MIPVFTCLEVKSSAGTLGYSFLQKRWVGEEPPRRRTFVFVRGSDGFIAFCLQCDPGQAVLSV